MATINWEIVDKLLEAGCDGTQVAAYLGIHPNTLYERTKTEKECDFSDYKSQKKAKGDVKLLAAQFESAIDDRDKAMMIWLGKQRLGQKEKQETDLNHSGGVQVIMRPVNYETK
jgi:predicted signal transduction protein with EAL and GGDEF domain